MSTIDDDRPTFGTYWRNDKEHTATKSLVFVVQKDPGRPNIKASEKTGESEQLVKDKRRAQVRRAQSQHRARKAHYTKQLEADIVSIRERIEDVDRDRCRLETENQAIRAQLCKPQHQQHQQHQQAAPDYGQPVENLSFYTTPTDYLQDFRMSYGLNSNIIDLDYFDVADTSLNEMLSRQGVVYHEDGSSAIAEGSRASSGIYSSPQYTDSGSNTPYMPLPESSSFDQSEQLLIYMSRFP